MFLFTLLDIHVGFFRILLINNKEGPTNKQGSIWRPQ